MALRSARKALGKLSPGQLTQLFQKNDIDFFAGVPDTILKSFCSHLFHAVPRDRHVITTNEGAAVGLAIGHYLSTRKPGLVYLENSGFGYTVDPLLSLCHKKVHRIPLMLLIGWRGAPGGQDDPPYTVEGEVQEVLLKAMGIPYKVLTPDFDGARRAVNTLCSQMQSQTSPVALLVNKETFELCEEPLHKTSLPMSREDVVQQIVKAVCDKGSIVRCTLRSNAVHFGNLLNFILFLWFKPVRVGRFVTIFAMLEREETRTPISCLQAGWGKH